MHRIKKLFTFHTRENDNLFTRKFLFHINCLRNNQRKKENSNNNKGDNINKTSRRHLLTRKNN